MRNIIIVLGLLVIGVITWLSDTYSEVDYRLIIFIGLSVLIFAGIYDRFINSKAQ